MLNSEARESAHDDARVIARARLRGVDVFRDLPLAELDRLVEQVRFQTIEKRDSAPLPVSDSDCLCFLMEGVVKLRRWDASGRETILCVLKPGELFGAPVVDFTTDVDVVALQHSVAGYVRTRELAQLFGESVFTRRISRAQMNWLKRMEQRIDDVSVGRVPERLARILLRLCETFPRALRCGTRVDVPFTQQDLASLVGASREVTSTTLNTFRRRGWLGIHNRYVCVHDRDELRSQASNWVTG